ncbi:DUF1513 domain-containing protein [uncultured Paracoccus sp.]|uniref:DUF1513 domain-containing protein n=1 Tax=uncultured Paracoccus sp. TaxID=189685 RepID=UPI002614A6F3|nr:DUF1513 domain-containing protein [uncultured Paracoccus sp.]
MGTRRHFLMAAAALAALPHSSWAAAGSPAYLAAAKDAEGAFAIHGLDARGESLFALSLPGRGHAAAAHPSRPEAVAFARRPGSFALVLDCAAGREVARLIPPNGRQFNGHGVFDAKGDLLMTSEVVAESSEGRVGLWAVDEGYARIGEWSTGGIGPHDMERLADGTLVVANGGIVTDPQDRSKLNLGAMRPSLTYLSASGVVEEVVTLGPELSANSIRHLALLPRGGVAFAMQWEGDPAEPVPLLGLHRRGAAPILCEAPLAEAFAMQGYAGSVAAAGGRIAITSPQGGAIMVFDEGGSHRATHRRADVCGVAPAAGGLLLTDGLGGIAHLTSQGLRVTRTAPLAWDNHLVALTGDQVLPA